MRHFICFKEPFYSSTTKERRQVNKGTKATFLLHFEPLHIALGLKFKYFNSVPDHCHWTSQATDCNYLVQKYPRIYLISAFVFTIYSILCSFISRQDSQYCVCGTSFIFVLSFCFLPSYTGHCFPIGFYYPVLLLVFHCHSCRLRCPFFKLYLILPVFPPSQLLLSRPAQSSFIRICLLILSLIICSSVYTTQLLGHCALVKSISYFSICLISIYFQGI